jgi:ribosomal protein L27
MAALAMDVYSRGYNAALADGVDEEPDDEVTDDMDGLGEFVGISDGLGPVEVFWTLAAARMTNEAKDIGFHAIAYQLTEAVGSLAAGTVVVAYRGTDILPGQLLSDFTKDLYTGYRLALGTVSFQSLMANQFFLSVREALQDQALAAWEALPEAARPPGPLVPDIVATGHSLGGGLAGYVGSLHHLDAALLWRTPRGWRPPVAHRPRGPKSCGWFRTRPTPCGR